MDKIKRLEEIGLKRVSDETHIEQKYIKYMVDCNFDKLNRINTLGFIKIISREYNLNLDDWVFAFEEYWRKNRILPEEEQDVFIATSSKEKSSKFSLFLVIVLLGVVGYFGYGFYTENSQSEREERSTFQEKLLQPQESEQATTYQETQEEIKTEELNTTVAELQNENPQQVVQDTEMNATNENPPIVVAEEEEKIDITNIAKTELTSEIFVNQAVIEPKSELWVGVIYLDDFKRRSYLGEGNFSIDLSREQIITTGHGSFVLKNGIEDKSYNRQTPIRLEVVDGVVKEISLSRFKELNRGNLW